MRKQVALLLASVMAISAMTVNAFAATNNYVDNRVTVPDKTAVLEYGITGQIGMPYLFPKASYGITDGTPDYYVDGTDLVVPLQRNVKVGYQFKLTLSNAQWYFRNNYDSSVQRVSSDGVTYYDALATKDFPVSQPLSTYDKRDGLFLPYAADPTRNDGTYLRTTASALQPTTVIAGIPYTEAMYKMDVSGRDNTVATVTLLDPANYSSTSGYEYSSTDYVLRIPLVTYISDSNVECTVTIDPGNASTVTAQKIIFANTSDGKTNATANSVTISRDVFDLDTFVINELRVGSIRSGQRIDLQLPSGYHFSNNWETDANPDDAHVQVGIESGMAWADGTTDYGTYVPATINSSNQVTNSLPGDQYTLTYGSYNTINDKLGYNTVANGNDDSVLSIYLGNINESTQLRGSVYIDNLQIWADDSVAVPVGGASSDILIHVKGDPDNITEQDVLVAQRVDWALGLKTLTTVPTLVSGRYIGPSWDGTDADDNTHKTARVQLYENASNSWWGARTTVLSLPATDNSTIKGAKFRKIDIVDSDKFNVPSGAPNFQDATYPSSLYSSSLNYQKSGAGTSGFVVPTDTGVVLNDGERHTVSGNYGAITVDYNTITFSNMSLQSAQRAWINMDLWVSVEYGFGAQTGDLKLAIDPSSTSITTTDTTTLPSVVIAHVVDPITVTTSVSDLKIGYQYQSTADIQIKENGAGYLLQNKTVRISISDLISSDMYFTNDTKVAVTSGDLKIKNLIAAGQGGFTSQSSSWLDNRSISNGSVAGIDGSGSISFDIDRESTVASTITISNIAVKLDRTVPVTNKNAYQVIVWGTAIAENYGLVDNQGRTWRADFNTVGDFKDYINVISTAPDQPSVLTQEVRVTIGENYYVVNGKTYSMDAVAYISPASNSTMVPVRFVANAFGLRDDQIMWDDANKTATINAPNKVIQFKLNSSTMIVNGVPITMTSPDGLPVVAEIKTIDGLGRMYLPFRALGNAFGVPVDWDADTQTAIYNNGANSNGAASVTNTTPVA